MEIKIKDGELRLDLVELIRENEPLLRECAKHALFNELLLKAMADVIVSGQVQWAEEELPWWVGGGSKTPFEDCRVALAALAEEGTQNLVADITKQRDKANAGRKVYQDRAWEAEMFVQHNHELLCRQYSDDPRRLEQLNRIKNIQAHATLE